MKVLDRLPMWKKMADASELEKSSVGPLFVNGVGNQYFLWSGGDIPPTNTTLGQRVQVTMDGWEGRTGTVVAWQVDGNWLGARVRMDSRPAWHVSEEPTRDVCFFVGRELKFL